jgi:amino acid adenylation domain-containing protein
METKVHIKDIYPLTPMQEGMLFHALVEKNTSAYWFQRSYRLKGTLDPNVVEKSLNDLFKRHDILRTAFIYEGVDRPLQVVLKKRQVDFLFKDLRPIITKNPRQKEIYISQFKEKDRQRTIDLTRDVLMRVAIFQVDDTEYELIWSTHHIIMDGWSLGIIISEFFEFYHSYIEKRPYQLPSIVPYRTYITWLEKQDMNATKNFWINYLQGYEELADIPKTTVPETRDKGYKKEMVVLTLEKEKTDHLKNLAVKNVATLNTVFQALWGILLGKYHGLEDVVFGTVVSGRPSELPGVNSILGLFINTIPVRIRFTEKTKFNHLLQRVQKEAIESENHHHFPLAEIQANNSLKQNLLDHIIVFENYPLRNHRVKEESRGKPGVQDVQEPGLGVLNVETFDHTNYDFSLGIFPGEQLTLRLNYNSNSYKREGIERISTHLKNVVNQILDDEEIFIGDLVLITREEREQLLFEYNDNKVDFPRDKTICQWIETNAHLTPDKIAVTGMVPGDSEDILSITYQQLNQKSNELAKALKTVGIREDELVGILLERSHIMVESILAVWKSGGAYIPIDTAYPVNRISDIMKDSRARVLFTESGYVYEELEKNYPGIIIRLDGKKSKTDLNDSFPNPDYEINLNRLAYVIYTSGSTGKPKGVMVEHIGMINHIQAKINDLQLTGKSIVAQNASHTFDIAVWQFFAALVAGGQTVIYPDELIMEPEGFISRLVNDGISILEVVPSYLFILLETLEERHNVPLLLNYLLVTGEEVKPHLVKRWFERYPHIKMVNAYGPTEASDDITHYIMEKAPQLERIPIGKPIQNLDIYIVDKNMEFCPFGIKGEICVSGIGVGRGYLNDEERTRQVFMEDPFTGERGIRLYKTGDIGCWLSDGTIEFFGRKDYQVKIRGYRIELGEIENILIRHCQVKEALVIDREDERGEKYLCAYVVRSLSESADTIIDEIGIKEILSRELPGYMIPEQVVELSEFPLTPNGKIDRSALPEPRGGSSTIPYISLKMLEELKTRTPSFPGHHTPSIPSNRLAREMQVLKDYSRQTGREYYPLSHSQKMIYYMEKRYPGTASENLAHVVRYRGQMDMKRLEQAINKVLYKNDGLRLRIVEIEHESDFVPAQYVVDYQENRFDYFDFSGESGEKELKEWMDRNTAKPFDLIDSDLFYFAHVKFNEEESGYYMNLHHIIADQWACFLLFKEINKVYEDLESGKIIDNHPNLSYLQYISYEREYLDSTRAKEDREFWHNYLVPLPEAVELSSTSGDITNVKGKVCYLTFPTDLRARMHQYRKNNKTSLYKLILSALSIYISRASGIDDFAVGAVNHNRSSVESHKKIVGTFIHFFPVRIKIDRNQTFRDFVKETGENINYLVKNHQEYPFELLANEIRGETGIEPGYLYNVNLIGHPDLEEESFVIERPFQGYETTPLTIHINRFNKDIYGTLELEWVYQVERFSETDIRQFHRCLVNILEDALSTPGKKIREIEIVSPEEKNQILYEFNTGGLTFPAARDLPQVPRNSRVYILSEEGLLQAVGTAGELCIGNDENGMMRRTGELARWLPDGNIEYLGRIDQQVRIDGKRIDAGAIERVFLTHQDITDAAVIGKNLHGSLSPGAVLCAYVVSGKLLPESELRQYLSNKVPPHMIPRQLMQLERMPYTASGKIDKKLLETVEIAARGGYKAPRNEMEVKLACIWQEVLGIEENKISVDDNFLELGGHSLKAIMMASKIHKVFRVKIPLPEIFKAPTIRALSGFITNSEKYHFSLIEPVEKKEYYALSSAQKRLFFLQQLSPAAANYNITLVVELEGKLERKKLVETFHQLIIYHESLRTSFEIIAGEPVQRVHDKVEFEIGDYLSLVKAEDTAGIIKKFIRPFDLCQAPLLRTGVIKIEDSKYILMVDMHHIISDGISHNILQKDFMSLYKSETLAPMRIQYKDYSRWQNRENQRKPIKKQEDFWLNQFEGEIPVLALPVDYSRPVFHSFEGGIAAFIIPENDTKALNRLALEEEATLYMVLMSIYYVLLYKLSGQEDIVIGAPTAGRMHADLQHIIGVFLNMLALRNFPGRNKTFKQFLHEVKEKILQAFENQEYQFEDLVEKLQVRRDTSRNPLFDVMFILQNQEISTVEIPGLKLKPFTHEIKTSKFDIGLYGGEIDRKIIMNVNYSTKLFKRETIELFMEYFKNIVSSILENPGLKLSEIEVSSKEKRTALLSQLNQQPGDEGVSTGMMGNGILQVQLNQCFGKFKDKTALEYGDHALSYQELNHRSNYIAHCLTCKGIKKETFIGILLENRIELIAAIIGILKTGCVFVPLDSTHPGDRLEAMIESTGIKCIISDNVNFNRLTGIMEKLAVECILSHDLFSMARTSSPWFIKEPEVDYSGEDKVYIYYTSGTTGTPRAMVGKNASLLHFIHWEIQTFGIDETFHISQFTTPGFDAFLRDVFAPLCSGGMICIPGKKEILADAEELIKWIEQSGINLIHCVPSLLRSLTHNNNTLTKDNFSDLKYILLSGEKIEPPDVASWYAEFQARTQLVNLWGTSETTLAKTCYFIKESDANRNRIPVGKPISGARVLVLDENMKLCDRLITGELYIATPFRTYGYYNDPLLNSQRFIRNPLNNHPDDILHKTGDLGRWLADGNLEVLGRNDRQVKIRGIRIELEEIESVLVRHPVVKEAAVIEKEISNHNRLLCAYVTVNEKNKTIKNTLAMELKEYLSQKLPAYMVPVHLIKVEHMPCNPNGKVDYKKLPDAVENEAAGCVYVPPENHMEMRLLKLWSEILGIETVEISVTKNFFELGGNSLNIISLVSKIHKEFNVKLSVEEVFNVSTIRKQAVALMGAKEDKYTSVEAAEKKDYYALSPAQRRFYVLHQVELDTTAYNMTQIMVLEGKLEREKLKRAFQRLIKRHESLRTSFEMLSNQAVQRIHEYGEVEFEMETAAHSLQPAAELIKNFIRPFDLSKAALMRSGLIKTKENEHILVVDIHHIISDAVSHSLLMRDFIVLYKGEELPRLRLQYKDYSQWQKTWEQDKKYILQEKYWLQQFDKNIPSLEMPTDYIRPDVLGFEGSIVRFEIAETESMLLKKMALEEGVTLYMILLSFYIILLSKLSGQEDIVVGIVTNGRRHQDLEQLMGVFINTMAFRSFPSKEITFKDFLGKVKKKSLEAFENQDYPFENLLKKLGRIVENRNPLFDVVFGFLSMEAFLPGIDIPDLTFKPYDYTIQRSRFDMVFLARELGSKLTFTIEYITKLFKKETIEQYVKYFKNIVKGVLEDPRKKIKEIDIMSEHEKEEILSIIEENEQNLEIEFDMIES